MVRSETLHIPSSNDCLGIVGVAVALVGVTIGIAAVTIVDAGFVGWLLVVVSLFVGWVSFLYCVVWAETHTGDDL